MHILRAATSLALVSQTVRAIDVDVNSPESLATAAKDIASSILDIYRSSSPLIPGIFPAPYYWWDGGLAWDALVNYWSATGDDTYVNVTREALVWQAGSDGSFMPANQTKAEGNDDQATWALACMTAAESGFSSPSNSGQSMTWLQMAQAVFDKQVARWDTTTCGGGLRWQIFAFNSGYNYKNTEANGDFMWLAARLALFTGNQTYADWARRTLEWTQSVNLYSNGTVYDGTITATNCSSVDHTQWTINYGRYLSASSYMSNFTQGEAYWTFAVDQLFTKAKTTFASAPNKNILTEITCQPTHQCDTDNFGFRAVLARALSNDLTLTGNSADSVYSNWHNDSTAILQASAKGAAAQCVVQTNGTVCGTDWTATTWDGTQGLGQSISALEVILANLPSRIQSMATNSTGTGTSSSSSNGTAGSNSTSTMSPSSSSAGPSFTRSSTPVANGALMSGAGSIPNVFAALSMVAAAGWFL